MENKEKIVNYETVLYTTIWEFKSPFSLEETKAKIKEWNWILILKRFAISNRVIRDNTTQERTTVDANTEITVELDTNLCNVLCYEEYKMTDVLKEKVEENLLEE